jgi:hypothetical protein
MFFSFPFPHEYPFGQTASTMLNIPLTTKDGFYYVGILTLLLLVLCLFFLICSLRKYHLRFVVTAIIVAVLTPPFVANLYQRTLATGIDAVHYDREESTCHFVRINEETLHGRCELPFENYSQDDV